MESLIPFCIDLHADCSVDEAWKELEAAGCTVLFSVEDPPHPPQLFAHIPEGCEMGLLFHVVSWKEAPLPGIDWEAQWALHAPGYRDGYLWIDPHQFGGPRSLPPIRLWPGPGFGDLSHPTTNLMLEMMASHVEHRNVIDVGCGSGVLSLCAVALGAKSVQGIDIDPLAIDHAKRNALLNGMEMKVDFFLPSEKALSLSSNSLILMNMIWSEQKEAMRSLSHFSGDCLISGIHVSERNAYLQYIDERGWKLAAEHQRDEWLGFELQTG